MSPVGPHSHINLLQTKVSAAGVQELTIALPECRIEWDGGVIEPSVAADPDRRAAEWVLSIGGEVSVEVNGSGRNSADRVE